jgi:hypothetical protein
VPAICFAECLLLWSGDEEDSGTNGMGEIASHLRGLFAHFGLEENKQQSDGLKI